MKLISAVLLPIIFLFLFSCNKGDSDQGPSSKDSVMLLIDYEMAGTTDAGHTYFKYDPVTRNLISVTFSLNTNRKDFYYDDKNRLSLVVHSETDANTKQVYTAASVLSYDNNNRIDMLIRKNKKTNQSLNDHYNVSVASDINNYLLFKYNAKGQVERLTASVDSIVTITDDYDLFTYDAVKDSLLLYVQTFLQGNATPYEELYFKSDSTKRCPIPENYYLFDDSPSITYWLNSPGTFLQHYSGKGPYMTYFARSYDAYGATETSGGHAYLYNNYNLPYYGTDGYFNSLHYTYMRLKK